MLKTFSIPRDTDIAEKSSINRAFVESEKVEDSSPTGLSNVKQDCETYSASFCGNLERSDGALLSGQSTRSEWDRRER